MCSQHEMLFEAFKRRNYSKVKSLIQYEEPSEEFYQLLFVVCDQKEPDDRMINVLLECKSIDINAHIVKGEGVLHALARCDNLNQVKELLVNFPALNLNLNSKNSITPLLIAAECGHLDILKYLHENGAEINARDIRDNTALHLAAKKGRLNCVKYLIETNPCCIDYKNMHDDTALLKAVEYGHSECTEYLLSMGADVYSRESNGRTCLHVSFFGKSLASIQILLRYITDKEFCDVQDNRGRTALHWASQGGIEGMVDALLREHADVNKVDDEGRSPLILAARTGRKSIVGALINAGADLSIRCKQHGNTAFMWAAVFGSENVVNYLLKHTEVNLSDKNNYGQTALMLAVFNGHDHIVNTLINAGISYSQCEEAFFVGIARGLESVFNALVKHKFNANMKNDQGQTALMLAVKNNNHNFIKKLIDFGASTAIQNAKGQTALHVAAEYHSYKSVVELLKYQTKVDAQDEEGNTALMLASRRNSHRKPNQIVIKVLVEAGANVNHVNKKRQTALILAVNDSLNRLQTVLEILKSQVNLDYQDREGNTALMLTALKGKHMQIAEALLNAGANVFVKNNNGQTVYDMGGSEEMRHLLQTHVKA